MNECNIVKDLLPLHAEELTSPDSAEFIGKHLDSCAACRDLLRRYQQELPRTGVPEQVEDNYKKPLKQSLWKIILSTVLASVLALAAFGYLLWEFGYLGRERIIESEPNGSDFRIKYYDADGFFISGGAYVVRPDGTGRNLRGDKSFVDLHVWWAPNGEAYFAWWQFATHDEAYFVDYRDIEAMGGWSDYKTSRDFYSENFFGELEALIREQGVEATDIQFIRWSDDSLSMQFRFLDDAGETRELWYSLNSKTITELE